MEMRYIVWDSHIMCSIWNVSCTYMLLNCIESNLICSRLIAKNPVQILCIYMCVYACALLVYWFFFFMTIAFTAVVNGEIHNDAIKVQLSSLVLTGAGHAWRWAPDKASASWWKRCVHKFICESKLSLYMLDVFLFIFLLFIVWYLYVHKMLWYIYIYIFYILS